MILNFRFVNERRLFISRIAFGLALTGAIISFSASSAVAQWTTPDGQGNISNTNSGNVGVGTTAPDKALEINSATGANLRLTYNDMDGLAALYVDFSVTSGGQLAITPSSPNILLNGAAYVPQNGGMGIQGSNGANILFGGNADVFLHSNAVWNTGWKYMTTNKASRVYASNGEIALQVAASGTAGSVIPWINALRATVDGNIGIGTITPGTALDINRTTTGGDRSYLYLSDTANIGHGITTLHPSTVFGTLIKGHATAGGMIVRGLEDTGSEPGLKLDGLLGNNNPSDSTPAVLIRGFKKDTGTSFTTLGNLETVFQVSNSSTNPLMTVLGSGNTGLGTTTPDFKLEVSGQINSSNGLCIAGDCKTAWSQVTGTQTWTTNGPDIHYSTGKVGIGISSPLYSLDVSGGLNGFRAKAATTSSNDAVAVFENTTGIQAIIRGNGNVGIGTTTPGAKLEVKSSANAHNSLVLNTTTASFADSLVFQEAGTAKASIQHNPTVSAGALLFNTNGIASPTNTRMVITGAGGVGIGTTTPAARLDVRQISGTLATLLMSYGANEDTYIRGGTSSAVIHIGDVTSTTSKVLLMENGGTVGIGTASPTTGYKLDVNGNTKVIGNIDVTGTGNITAAGTIEAGNIKAKYQDVAEWVPSTHALPAGTVVTLDPTKSNHVEASSRSYDTRVAGVISAQPGIALGEQGDNKVLVATTGRVKIKVDASDGPIQVGDLLVTSSVPGVAMRSQPIDVGSVQIHRPGTLIGKALEPLAKGQGEILVLLSLQ